MARERKVFPRDMVAHLWANRAQDQARDSGGSFYFSGPTLYSYGSHFVIGHWLDTPDGTRLVWNDYSYSNTTSKHQSIAAGAVRRFDWDRAIHVPSLDANGLWDWHSVARRCVDAAMTALEKAQKARQRRAGHIGQAIGYLDSARVLFTIAGESKAAAALPALAPDADKGAVDSVLREAKKAEYIGNAEREMTHACEAMEQARRAALGEDIGPGRQKNAGRTRAYSVGDVWAAWGTQAESVMHAVTAARHYVRHALNFYRQAGKKSTRAGNILRECDQLAAKFEKDAQAARQAARLDIVRVHADEVREMFYAWKHQQKTGAILRRSGNNVHWHASKLAEAMRACDAGSIPADVQHLARRVELAIGAARLSHALADIRAELADSDSEPPCMPVELRDALRHATELPQFWRAQIEDVQARVTAARAQWESEREARNAQAIQAWREGAAGVRPAHDWPTIARIKGDSVETSRGAVVPLSHACRLARIARRVIAAGGKEWPGNDGPRIGHFQVQSIGADGSAVIGCHEFSAAEGARMLALLESCPACAHVGAED